MFDWQNNPYGYPGPIYSQHPNFSPFAQQQMPNYQQNNLQQNYQQNAQSPKVNTNKIFVNGIEGAKTLQLPNNSCVLACDNDLDVVYEITTDSMGKRSIIALDVSEHKETEKPAYATKEELLSFKEEINEMIKGIKEEK